MIISKFIFMKVFFPVTVLRERLEIMRVHVHIRPCWDDYTRLQTTCIQTQFKVTLDKLNILLVRVDFCNIFFIMHTNNILGVKGIG